MIQQNSSTPQHIGGESSLLTVSAGIVVVGVGLCGLLFCAGALARFLGQTGINIAGRIMGILLGAIAIEMMAAGLKGLFPALGS